MAFFEDLGPCSYFGMFESVLDAVGWLETDRPFERGEVSKLFFQTLFQLCVEPWQPMISGGGHACSLCRFSGGPGQMVLDGVTAKMGNANVFVPGPERVFVAPSTILHYIDAHHYVPPMSFQQAVMECPEMRSFEYLKALKDRGVKRWTLAM